MVTEEQVRQALRDVMDPEIGSTTEKTRMLELVATGEGQTRDDPLPRG